MPQAVRESALAELRREVMQDRSLPMARQATQAVFGEGPLDPPLMLVGEQPGDAEDLAGRPFVGPAGRLLDRALEDAELDRRKLWVTNAVKHFKFTPSARRRLHAKPTTAEIAHYRPFLTRELALVRPRLVVALGATAVQALLTTRRPLAALRGAEHAMTDGGRLRATVHPSYLLRLPDAEARRREYARFVEDLRIAAAGVT
jgi:uracil-DNA glycosylase